MEEVAQPHIDDPFAGPGRIQVAGESVTRDGGAVVAWRALTDKRAPFTRMLVGDLARDRAQACERRLRALAAPVESYAGPAIETVKAMVHAVPRGSLAMAILDPYNLELLAFSIIQELSKLKKVDLAINFSTMDLQRNADLEFDPTRARFDDTAPGWRQERTVLSSSKQNVKVAFFNYWCQLVQSLGFEYSKEMPMVTNNQGRGMIVWSSLPGTICRRGSGETSRGVRIANFSPTEHPETIDAAAEQNRWKISE